MIRKESLRRSIGLSYYFLEYPFLRHRQWVEFANTFGSSTNRVSGYVGGSLAENNLNRGVLSNACNVSNAGQQQDGKWGERTYSPSGTGPVAFRSLLLASQRCLLGQERAGAFDLLLSHHHIRGRSAIFNDISASAADPITLLTGVSKGVNNASTTSTVHSALVAGCLRIHWDRYRL